MRLGEREGAPKAVMLTTFGTAEVVTEAMQDGASGFLVKDLPAPE